MGPMPLTLCCLASDSDRKPVEQVLDAGSNSHCFTELQSAVMYRVSVYGQLQTAEGPPVTVLHSTSEYQVCET